MFIEYWRILNLREVFSDSSYPLMFKFGLISLVGLILIYFGYKLLGKWGAIVVLLFELLVLGIANDMLPQL